MQPTTELVSQQIKWYPTFREVLAASSGSPAGYHANSEWLTCPERSRLRAIGVRRKPFEFDKAEGLNELDFGTLIHHLLAVRVLHKQMSAVEQLNAWRAELGEVTYERALTMLGVYEQTFPEALDSLQFVAVEPLVITDIGAGCLRTVRYDAIVVAISVSGERQLYALERKTMSRSGPGSINAYKPQLMVQVAVWNTNAALVAKYGKVQGVIVESLVKTKLPSVDREIRYITPREQALALEYLRYAEGDVVRFKQLPDGTYPKMLHSCWGRWRPCDYIGLCHEENTGDYELPNQAQRGG